jgi:PAS domain S-box-containing protein
LNLFQAIVEQAPDPIIFADRDGAIRVWNRGAETVFGYAADEVLGKSLDVIIPERLAVPIGRVFAGPSIAARRSTKTVC